MDKQPAKEGDIAHEVAMCIAMLAVGMLSGVVFETSDRAFGAFIGFAIGLTVALYWISQPRHANQ